MTTRIRDLAAQANIEMEDGNYSLVSVEELTQFAELIIQECAKFSRQYNLENADRSYMIHTAMKEHFGVEE